MSTVPDNPPIAGAVHGGWRDYLELTKPKVSLLIVFTAIVGMVLASPGWIPDRHDLSPAGDRRGQPSRFGGP